jgi:hypothetical protein
MKVLLPLALVVLMGCARSPMYHRDNGYFDEGPEGYYQSGASESKGLTGSPEKLKQPRKRILVMGFWNDTPLGDESIGIFAADELKRGLFLGKKVIFPDEKTSTAVTRDFVDGDRIQSSQLVREGKRLGVSTIVIGRISKIVFRQSREEVGLFREAQTQVNTDIEMKVFDAITGREVHSAKRSGVATTTAHVVFDEDALSTRQARSEIAKDAVADAVRKIIGEVNLAMEKMDWQGRVAKIVGNKVYVNAGRDSGLLAGDILKVMSPGEEIVDPITKSYLGRSEGMLKGTLEVSEFVGKDTSMGTIHTGGNFQEGDVVLLY